ncbi:hypothetical protein GCM10009504_21930 [Pseudomonas laurentiana]|nr:hypothetical protein GCM10009504_21930 [Pseudomonas laurentiana]
MRFHKASVGSGLSPSAENDPELPFVRDCFQPEVVTVSASVVTAKRRSLALFGDERLFRAPELL